LNAPALGEEREKNGVKNRLADSGFLTPFPMLFLGSSFPMLKLLLVPLAETNFERVPAFADAKVSRPSADDAPSIKNSVALPP